jgi:hypothetical protein
MRVAPLQLDHDERIAGEECRRRRAGAIKRAVDVAGLREPDAREIDLITAQGEAVARETFALWLETRGGPEAIPRPASAR